ncbi:radical SAM/SPASM domain-containing protein [Campylobacter hepaticus]|uniref:Radical SAM/SPASM domain-containing protein n=1 Tax=Campylobacter hepaticus TaxID=1813019 RepID=A0A424Z1H8_9BACT|nr:radical SAM/SPASM domain-containing protein [Campylobacter hepaticus]AXP09325.1 radical SAM/SPASM domain-containing protein [Campylobacter hepaticus]MDX2323563.1 SPASM domain-containing protein [Campylobacter hepaticus]MDX2331405.1 SPASM domain-containing protein [Campylobacter hepaticus]MDX2332825.1 SPASM domain-containing protein [Campylobacter hepaticus]MDX2372024.1 SPASM domain-containing protein [Campylobacter hepaticus]
MKFKKIYIELSDICGLKCDFCPSKKASRGIMSVDNFSKLAKQIYDKSEIFTFHLLGDPLLLDNLENYLQIAKNYEMKLEITTSGFYFSSKNSKLLLEYDNIRQINISLMAFLSQKKLTLKEYLKPILAFCKEHLENKKLSFINLRLWNLDAYFKAPKENDEIYKFLAQEFGVEIFTHLAKNRLQRHILLHQDKLFKWPNLKEKAFYKKGKCHALKEQIGILSNGNLVPCCLDTQGDIYLGNVFKDDFIKLLKSPHVEAMKKAFKKNERIEKLCQTCEFFKTRLNG